MHRKLILPLMALALIVWVAGCSKNSSTPTGTNNGNSSISQQFGGFDATPAAPNFADPALTVANQGELQVNDPVALTPAAVKLLNDTTSGVFHLRAVWGHLRYDSTATTPVNWDGSLEIIPRGIVILRKKIRFEPATDSILHRDSANLLQWASTTTVGSDGIEVDLLVPKPKPTFDTMVVIQVDSLGDTTRTVTIDTIPGTPGTVEFKTTQYSRTFTLAELAKLDTIIYFSDSSAISFNAFEVRHIGCPRGLVSGFWGVDSSGIKMFRGMWMSRSGLLQGSLEGIITTDTFGVNVFFGKWIDQSGAFQGLLRGIWGLMPDEHASMVALGHGHGWFFGGVYDANGTLIGALRGHFRGPKDSTSSVGFFDGRWKIACPNEGKGEMDDGMNGNEFEIPFMNNHKGGH